MAEKRTRKFRSDVSKDLLRISLTISREMDMWVQSLSHEMKASGGYKLPKSFILRSLINAMMKLKVDVGGVRTEEELEKRFLRAIKQYKE